MRFVLHLTRVIGLVRLFTIFSSSINQTSIQLSSHIQQSDLKVHWKRFGYPDCRKRHLSSPNRSLQMVNPIKVGMAALLIFVTFSQSAPADPGDEKIDRMARALVAKRLNTIKAGLTGRPPCAIKLGQDPIPVILQRITDVIDINVPEGSPCTYNQVLNPSTFMAMGHVQLRIARAYHACIFEMLKRLFLYIQSCVPGQYANPRGCSRLLAGLALIWDVLVVYYILENMCRRLYSHAKQCDGLELPIYYTFSNHLHQQCVSKLSRDTAQPFAFSHNLRHIMDSLRSFLKDEIAQLQRDYGLSPTERDAPPVRPAHECLIADGARQERNLPRDASEACGVLRRPSEVDALITRHYQLLNEYQASVAEGAQAARQNYNMFNQPNAHGNNEASPSVINLTND
ncbi:hypothetical protein SeLEV6574_g08410, partial [Synchytrium endobioticum]